MATTNINAVAATANTSADFSLTAGACIGLALVAASPIVAGCGASIQIKGSNGVHQDIGRLDRDAITLVLQTPGTFRVVKGSNSDLAFGVDKND